MAFWSEILAFRAEFSENIVKYQCPPVVSVQKLHVSRHYPYKREAEQWMRSRVDNKLIHVFNMAEFQKWANSEKL